MSKNVVKLKKPHTIWRLRLTYWISKATRASRRTPAPVRPPIQTHTHMDARNTHTHALKHALARAQKYVILLLFHGNNGFMDAPQC